MIPEWLWSYLLTGVGCTGFWLAGRKVWWSWWVNVGCQGLWASYAVATQQWGFLLGIPVYLVVFIPNAVRWTREHRAQRAAEVTRG